MFPYTLYDPKTKKQFCDRVMTDFEADKRNADLRAMGRTQRWILKKDIPEDADKSLIGLGVWK
jgi:hypothetical protein